MFVSESYKKGFFLSTFFNLFSKSFSFASNLIVAYFFGTTTETDIYFLLLALLAVPIYFITSLTGTILIPEGMQRRNNQNLEGYFGLLNFFILLYFLICFFLMLFFALFPVSALTLFSRFSLTTLQAHKNLILLAIPLIGLNTLSATFSDILISYKMFTIPSLVTVANSLCCIAFILIFHSQMHVASIFLGNIAAFSIQILFQLYLMKKYIGWRFSIFRPQLHSKLFKDILVAQSGSLITSIMGYFPLYLLSTYSNGIIAAFNYGQRVIDIIINLITIQFLSVLGIRLNQVWAEKKELEIGSLFIRLTKSISLILIPLSFFIALYAQEIMRLLFMRGKFDGHSANLSAHFLQIAVFILPATAINGIVAKCFMAAQKIQKSFMYQIVMGIIMIIFVFAFIKIKGSLGYPMALSAFWWINVLAMNFIMKNNFPQIPYIKALGSVCRITFYVLPVVVPLYFIKRYFLSERILISCIIGAAAFFGVLLLAIKNNYLDEIPDYIGGMRSLYKSFTGKKT